MSSIIDPEETYDDGSDETYDGDSDETYDVDLDEIYNASTSVEEELRLLRESQERQEQLTDNSLKEWIISKLQEFLQNMNKTVQYPNQLLDDVADKLLELFHDVEPPE